jgi:stage V sporulation protein D (sporulation-specific penicillin-binding protein)
MQTTGLLVRKRILALFLLFIVIFLALGTRIFWVQFVRGAELSAKATQNRMRDVPVEAKRGAITDRNGRELAISISTDSVYAIPAEINKSKKSAEIAKQLAEILNMNEADLLKRITRASSFEWVKRQINPTAAKKIRELELPAISWGYQVRIILAWKALTIITMNWWEEKRGASSLNMMLPVPIFPKPCTNI